jgi:hypothetical protein
MSMAARSDGAGSRGTLPLALDTIDASDRRGEMPSCNPSFPERAAGKESDGVIRDWRLASARWLQF